MANLPHANWAVALAALAGPAAAMQAGFARDSCACLPWTDVYSSFGVECGEDGPEYYPAMKFTAMEDVGKQQDMYHMIAPELCNSFYKRFPDSCNFCANHDFTNATDGQWCYVSADCNDLNGGKLAAKGVKWKYCTKGSDEMLRDRTPDQVVGFKAVSNPEMNLGLTLKSSYPIWPVAHWPEVEKLLRFTFEDGKLNVSLRIMDLALYHFGGTLPGGDPRREMASGLTATELRNRVQELIDSGKPTIVDSWYGHPPFMVIHGPKIYKLEYKDVVPDSFWAPGIMKGKPARLGCHEGCDESEKEEEPVSEW